MTQDEYEAVHILVARALERVAQGLAKPCGNHDVCDQPCVAEALRDAVKAMLAEARQPVPV